MNDPEFYARMGIDPAGTVTPAAAAEQVEQVTSVVASVALVTTMLTVPDLVKLSVIVTVPTWVVKLTVPAS